MKVFRSQEFIADFTIASEAQLDDEGDVYYSIDPISVWDFPLDQRTLPKKYTKQLGRNPSSNISEADFSELIGIRNFTQNLRLNYKNRLLLYVSELEVERLLDSKNALRQHGLEIIERQCEITPGNIIDLLCKDTRGDLVVVELKKGSANQVIGQLARYVTDVRETRAKATQKVRGLVLTLDVDEQLIKAARGVDFDVSLCQLTFG
ncbi:MAG: endonuclease NucS domain-containing protein [Terriglobia bacterium]